MTVREIPWYGPVASVLFSYSRQPTSLAPDSTVSSGIGSACEHEATARATSTVTAVSIDLISSY